ncbi:MAG: hypothetical protein GY847_37135 [Proteobacteria bacterium]|nr:hypothetical protein [Pseudomonadota bacterium]
MNCTFYRCLSISLVFLASVSCGQENINWPDGGLISSGECGAWYPGGGKTDAGVESQYGIEEGSIFPCLVWESARLNSQDTYINIGDIYLKRKNSVSETKAIIVVVSAKNCPTCSSLIEAMESKSDDFDTAGALMIGMARRDLQGAAEDPDFNLDDAETVLRSENWKTDEWYVINDEENHLNQTFDSFTPWIILVSTSNMIVRSLSNTDFPTDISGVDKLLGFIEDFE